jgi:hypothetical protein
MMKTDEILKNQLATTQAHLRSLQEMVGSAQARVAWAERAITKSKAKAAKLEHLIATETERRARQLEL